MPPMTGIHNGEVLEAELDLLWARQQAIVDSWFEEGVQIPTSEEVQAEIQIIRDQYASNGTPEETDETRIARVREYRTRMLRQAMSLKASKPRNATSASGPVGDSSDEEEGRSGLGKTKHGKRTKAIARERVESRDEGPINPTIRETVESGDMDTIDSTPSKPTQEDLKVKSRSQKTAKASSPSATAQEPCYESSDQDLKDSAHAMFKKQKSDRGSKKRKLADSRAADVVNEISIVADQLYGTTEEDGGDDLDTATAAAPISKEERKLRKKQKKAEKKALKAERKAKDSGEVRKEQVMANEGKGGGDSANKPLSKGQKRRQKAKLSKLKDEEEKKEEKLNLRLKRKHVMLDSNNA